MLTPKWTLYSAHRCNGETPGLELKSLATFLAIKRCRQRKFGKLIMLARSSFNKWVHVCAHRGKAVNSSTPLGMGPYGPFLYRALC